MRYFLLEYLIFGEESSAQLACVRSSHVKYVTGKQRLSRYRLAILAPTSGDLEELKLGITSVEAALPLDEEQFPINPIKFLDFRGKITVNN